MTLAADEVVELAARMVDTPWCWTAETLDGFLSQLGLERDGELSDIALLPLRSDRIPGQAGMVMGLTSGAVYSVSVALTGVVARDDEAGQAELDRVVDEAKKALAGRFGRPGRGSKGPAWKLGDHRLTLDRLRVVVHLTLVHLANKATFEGT